MKEPIMKAVQKLLEEQVSASGSHVTGGGTTPPGRNVQNRRASLTANPVEPIVYPVTNNRQPLLPSDRGISTPCDSAWRIPGFKQ